MNANLSVLNNTTIADATKRSLREAIFWNIAYETNAHLCGHLDDVLESMRETAEAAVPAGAAELLCDGQILEKFNFSDDYDWKTVSALRHLQRVLLQRGCWFEDVDQDDGVAGFCWGCGDHHYQLIFR